MSVLPRRRPSVEMRQVGPELLLVDADHQAHVLSAEAAALWEALDGRMTVAGAAFQLDMPQEQVVHVVEQLQAAGLVVDGPSRRTLLRGATVLGGAAVVSSVALPSAFAAGSGLVQQLGQVQETGGTVSGIDDYFQRSVSSGNSYAAPSAGTVAAFRTTASSDTVSTAGALVIFRPQSDGSYAFVSRSPGFVYPTTRGTVTSMTLAVPLPVQAGDLIGLGVMTDATLTDFVGTPFEDADRYGFLGGYNGQDSLDTSDPSQYVRGVRVNVTASFQAN